MVIYIRDIYGELIALNLDNFSNNPQGGNGKSAYEIAISHGFNGTEKDWLESLKGKVGPTGIQGPKGMPGDRGQDGKSLEFNWNDTQLGIRQQGENFYQYIDLKGTKGDTGEKGLQGEVGPKGDKGDKGIYVGIKESAPLTADIVIDDSDIGLYVIDDLTVTPIVDSTINLTLNKYQTTTMTNNTTIILPTVDKFMEIHLFFDTTEELTLTLPNIKWQDDINIEANKTYEFIFTYINNNWFGGCITYNE